MGLDTSSESVFWVFLILQLFFLRARAAVELYRGNARVQPRSLLSLRRFAAECRSWDQLLLRYQESAEEMSRWGLLTPVSPRRLALEKQSGDMGRVG